MNPEVAVIGLAMHSRDVLDDIDPEDFGDLRHRALIRLMRDMARKGEATDAMAMSRAYLRIDETERRGIDGAYLFDCLQAAPQRTLTGQYVRMVADAATARRLEAVFARGLQMLSENQPASEVAELARGAIDSANKATAKIRPIGDIVDGVLDDLEKPARAYPSPWPELNEKLVGWRHGALYVVGARPGVGKSIVALQAAIGLAEHGWVAFNSLEMPENEIVVRAISQMADVALGRLQGVSDSTTRLDSRDWDRISRVRPKLGDLKLSIDDRSSATIMDIRSHARSLARKGPLAGVVVDYLQLMSTARGDRRPRHEIVAEYSRELKVMAKEMGCPVIALSQLNRASEGRQDKRPILADLRESGAVEQDADVVLLLHVPEEDATDMDMLVGKNRHGVLGPVRLTRRGEFARVEPRQWRPSHTIERTA